MIISKKSLIPLMTVGSVASGCCLYWQYQSNIDLSVTDSHSVVGFMVANPTSGGQLKIQHRENLNAGVANTSSKPVASNAFKTLDPSSVGNVSGPKNTKPIKSNDALISPATLTTSQVATLQSTPQHVGGAKITTQSPNLSTKTVQDHVKTGSSTTFNNGVSSSDKLGKPLNLNNLSSIDNAALTPATNNSPIVSPISVLSQDLSKPVLSKPLETVVHDLTSTDINTIKQTPDIVAKPLISPKTQPSPTQAQNLKTPINPCDSSSCYASQVAPILKKFINESLTEEEMVRQIKENTQTNKNQEFQSKVARSIEYAKKYIILKGEIKETTKQINEIQNTNSILSGELSSGKVKKTEQIEKIQQKTAEVNAIKFTSTIFMCDVVDRKTTAATNNTTHLSTCLEKAIQKLERQQTWLWGLTTQDTKNLQNFKYNLNTLNLKAWVNTEIQNMKNDLIGITRTIITKSNMIAANKVKVQSNEDKKTLALRKQEQIIKNLGLSCELKN